MYNFNFQFNNQTCCIIFDANTKKATIYYNYTGELDIDFTFENEEIILKQGIEIPALKGGNCGEVDYSNVKRLKKIKIPKEIKKVLETNGII